MSPDELKPWAELLQHQGVLAVVLAWGFVRVSGAITAFLQHLNRVEALLERIAISSAAYADRARAAEVRYPRDHDGAL